MDGTAAPLDERGQSEPREAASAPAANASALQVTTHSTATAVSAPTIDQSELYYLIADFLKRQSPCQYAADVLIHEMQQHQLLKPTIQWDGRMKPSTYVDYRMRHRDIAPNHLIELLQNAAAGNFNTTKPSSSDHLPTIRSQSILLKCNAASSSQSHTEMSDQQRKTLAKKFIATLFSIRRVEHTIRMVEKIINKYDRLRAYLHALHPGELPLAIQQELLKPEPSTSTDVIDLTQADKASILAPDVRALKQLMQLRHEQMRLQQELRQMLMDASHVKLFQAPSMPNRIGRNHASRLRRREVHSHARLGGSMLPPVHICSRIRRLKTLNGHLQIPTYCLTYDKSGKYVITGSDDRLIKIWSLATGDLKFTLRGHIGNITDLAVNQSNTLLASSSDDRTVRVWELSTGFPVAVLLGHSSVVNSVRFHPSKNVVVTASDDGRCFCYKLPDIERCDEPETKIQTAQRLLRVGAYCRTLQPLYSLSHAGQRQGARSCKVLCLTFSRCGNFVVTGSQDGIGRVWDVSVFSQLETIVPAVQSADAAVSGADAGNLPSQTTVAPPDAAAEAEAAQTPAPVEPGQLPPAPLVTTDTANEAPAPQDNDPLPIADQVVDSENPLVERTAEAAAVAAASPQRQQSQLPPVQQPELPTTAHVAEDEIPRLPNSEPIALLKGHKGPITNVIYSHQGDQIATASIKDGTTRVWTWEKRYKKIKEKVLFARMTSEHDREQEELAILYGLQSNKKRPAPAVDTLMWTHNDKRLITLHSVKTDESMQSTAGADWKQRVHVWDPRTGELIMTLAACDPQKLYGHTNAVFAMDVHPSDWRVIVTAGYDGRIIIWDIEHGKVLKQFANTSPEGEMVPMLDGGFMPDGGGFCFTDRIGRLLIFGTGSGEQYAATPVQQYFQHDYIPLVTDRNFHVIDRETQMMPHLMESGPLVDIYCVAYPHQPPHLQVRDPESTDTDALDQGLWEENRRLRVQQCKESEIKCAVWTLQQPDDEPEEESFPCAILNERKSSGPITARSPRSLQQQLATMSFRLNGDPVLLSELRRRRRDRLQSPGARRRGSGNSLDDRDTSILNVEISSDDDRSDEDFQVPSNQNVDDEEDEDDEEEDDEELSLLSDDEETLRSTRRRISQDDGLRSTRRGRVYGGNGRVLGRNNNEQEERSRRRRLRRRYGSARSSSEDEQVHLNDEPRRTSRTVEDDEEEEDEADGTRLRSRPQRRRRTIVSDDEGEEVDPHSDDDIFSDASTSQPLAVEAAFADEHGSVVVETNDGFIMGDNQVDRFDTTITFDQLLQAKRDQQDPTQLIDESQLITCAFCGEGNDGGMLKLPGDAFGVHPLINGAQRVFVHDQCAIASPLCFHRGGRWYNVMREIRRGRSLICAVDECKKRGATIGCALPKCPKSYHWKCAVSCGWSMNQIHFYCPDHEYLRSEEERQRDQSLDANGVHEPEEEPVSKRFGLSFQRDWLQQTSLRDQLQYVPQVGDHVVYLPEGHDTYLKGSQCERIPSWFLLLRSYFAVRCRVVDVKYLFPPSDQYNKSTTIRCQISLAVLAIPTPASAREEAPQEETKSDEPPSVFGDNSIFASFVGVDRHLRPSQSPTCERLVVKFMFYAHELANFLVLDHAYVASVRWNWQVGDQVALRYSSPNENQTMKQSCGVITAISTSRPPTSVHRVSPWESIELELDDEAMLEALASPWELELVQENNRATKRAKDRARREVQAYCARQLIGSKQQALLSALAATENLSIAQDFLYPVGDSVMDYLIIIANPMDLSLLKARVQNRYYRQIEAFIRDAQLLYLNCEKYNVETSAIAQNSRAIYSTILTHAQQHFVELRDADVMNARSTHARWSYPVEVVDASVEILDDVDGTIPEFTNHVPQPAAATATTDHEPEPPQLDPVVELEDASSSPSSDSEEEVAIASSVITTRHTTQKREPASSTKQEEDEEEEDEEEEAPRHVRTRKRSHEDEQEAAPAPTTKRARSESVASPERELMTYPGLLENLTTEQRQILQERCEEELFLVVQDLHSALMQADVYGVFAQPVTEDIAPNYFSYIKSPMDFGTMADTLANYRSFKEYFMHIRLVFHNAIVYNTWDSQVGEVVLELQGHFVKFLLDAIDAGQAKPTKRSAGNGKTKSVKKKPASTPKHKPKRRSNWSDVDDEEEEEESDFEEESEDEEQDESDEDSDDSELEDDDSSSDDDGFSRRRRRPQRKQQVFKKSKSKKPSKKRRRRY